jgi:hypothetical protein
MEGSTRRLRVEVQSPVARKHAGIQTLATSETSRGFEVEPKILASILRHCRKLLT